MSYEQIKDLPPAEFEHYCGVQPETSRRMVELVSNHLSRKRRVMAGHVIRSLKIFRILAERYRNRRKRFAIRFNLIAGLHNYEPGNDQLKNVSQIEHARTARYGISWATWRPD